MLLVEFTIGATVHYISNEGLALDRFYDPYIASLGQFRIATRQPYGGVAEATFGQLDLLPTLFGDDLPPVSCPIKISIGIQLPGYYAELGEEASLADEVDATYVEDSGLEYSDASISPIWVEGMVVSQLIFAGTAHLNELKLDAVIYDLYRPTFAAEVTDFLYSGELTAVFATAWATLGVGLDTTYARVPSPIVNHTAPGTRKLIDNLSDIAAFFAHRFYFAENTLHLIDCLLDNGDVMALEEGGIFPSSYTWPGPVSKFTAKYPALTDRYMLADMIVQGGGTNKASFSEIQLRSVSDGTDMTSSIGGGAFAKDTPSPNNPGSAIDDNAATFWQSATAAGTSGMHWGFVFPIYPVPVIEYTITAPPTLNEAPVYWKLQAYDVEAGVWRTIKEEKTSTWSAAEEKKFTLSQPTWDVIVAGTYKYDGGSGMDISPTCRTSLVGINTALGDIKTIMERPRVQISMPITNLPKIGQKITLTDESLHRATTIWARVASLVLDFDNDQCVIEGEGALA